MRMVFGVILSMVRSRRVGTLVSLLVVDAMLIVRLNGDSRKDFSDEEVNVFERKQNYITISPRGSTISDVSYVMLCHPIFEVSGKAALQNPALVFGNEMMIGPG
jgi:hypothetical protein